MKIEAAEAVRDSVNASPDGGGARCEVYRVGGAGHTLLVDNPLGLAEVRAAAVLVVVVLCAASAVLRRHSPLRHLLSSPLLSAPLRSPGYPAIAGHFCAA